MPDQYLVHPRFEFSEQRLINQILTQAALSGTTTTRVAGTRFAVAIGIFTLTGGAGTVRFLVEGTLDGTNWFTLASTTAATDFTGSGTVILNASSSGLIDLQRFQSIRTRAVIVAGAPVFTLQTIVTGIARDGEAFDLDDTTFTRAGAVPVSQTGDSIVRPSGTLLANCQITATGVVLGGVASFDVSLQGSPDGGTTWETLGTVAVSGNGSSLMAVNGETFFSLGAYMLFRFVVVDNGVAGALTAFTITTFLGIDSSDWTSELDSGSSGTPFDPSEVFVQVLFGAPTAEAANTRTVGFQVVDADGNPILEARRVELILYDTSNAGDVVLALNATFSAVTTGVAIAGVGTNRVIMTTDATGQGNVSVLDAAVETTFLTAVNPRGPQTTPQIIVAAAQVPLAFV